MEIDVSTGLIPDDGRTARQRYRQNYRQTAAGQEARRRDRKKHRDNKRVTDYLNKEFVAWDGEGGNEDDGSHTYFLLASSDEVTVTDRNGLSTVAVFELWLNSRKGVTNIIFGGGYDFNMVLRDLDRQSLESLYTSGKVWWKNYFIEWRAGKSFRIVQGERRFLIYDVLPFFQRPFVDACDEYLGNDWECRNEIIAGKKARGSFDWSQINEVSEYNRAELRNLVRLANELRTRLHKVDIRVGRWDGPGAIATALYRKYETKSYLAPTPDEVAECGRYAYAGGRFEIIRKGHSMASAYQYDIRSAYPSAIRYLPCLVHGRWEHRVSPRRIVGFGVYRVEVVNPPTDSITQPQPLWMRNKNGTVYFAEYSHGWYWSPEAQLAQDLGGSVIHEGWEWIQECDHTPFSFVEGLYNKRAALKRARDGAHVGLKLGLNSLYGKLAQQIGWDPGPPIRIPPYHSLEWAGWITSHCRAQVFRANLCAPDDVIAFETDAIFSRAPLALDIGEQLGQWEATEYTSLTYLKSGMYYGTKIEKGVEKEVEKTRGINHGSIDRATVIKALQDDAAGKTVVIPAEQTRFVGLGQALHQDFGKWRRWYTDPRMIGVALNGKRIDLLDRADQRRILDDGWQETQEGFSDTEFSYPYEVEWIEATEIRSNEDRSLPEERLFDSHGVYEGMEW